MFVRGFRTVSAYTPAGFHDTVLDTPSLLARMEQMHILVACLPGEIIGTVAGAVGTGGEGPLRGMAVLPAHHGTGIAAQLLGASEEWLANQGCRRVALDTTRPLVTQCISTRNTVIRDPAESPISSACSCWNTPKIFAATSLILSRLHPCYQFGLRRYIAALVLPPDTQGSEPCIRLISEVGRVFSCPVLPARKKRGLADRSTPG